MKERIVEILREFPGLTGKQIANKLGDISKSELNSFLYKNPDGLVQIDWKWYIDNDEYVLTLSNQSWIDEEIFEKDLASAGCMLESSQSTCVIRFPERMSTRLNSIHRCISYAVFCLNIKS